MSTKVSVIIGDYQNSWGDAWVVMQPSAIEKLTALKNDKRAVMAVMTDALHKVVEAIESNQLINPVDPAEACCAGFQDWAKKQTEDLPEFCGKCGKRITDERRESAKVGF